MGPHCLAMENMKPVVLHLIFLLCGLFARADVSASDAEQTLTILHTSEHHGAALPVESGGHNVGGMAARAALIATVRRETERVLLVDSGDILIGTALSSAFRGEPDIKAMNQMGYQAMGAGNHEFDFGLDHFRRLNELAEFPILCSNVVGRSVELPCRASVVVRVGDLSIGLIGLLGRSNFPTRSIGRRPSFSSSAIPSRPRALLHTH